MPASKSIEDYKVDIDKLVRLSAEGYSRKDAAAALGTTESIVRTLRKKMNISSKDTPRSKRHSKKISEAALKRYEGGFEVWNKNKPCSEETRRKISAAKEGLVPWNMGIPCRENTKNKISMANKGRKHTEEARAAQRANTPRGPKHWNWQGGVSRLTDAIRKSPEYKMWRRLVYVRDDFTCVQCRHTGYLNADHIVPFSTLIKENNINNIKDAVNCKKLWDINNGRTLCVPCHRKTETYGKGALRFERKEP